jgi:hypothetical protein
MDKLTLVMITDGRRDAFEQTTLSAQKFLDFYRFDNILVINDCLDPEYAIWLDSMVGSFKILNIALGAGEKQGFSGAIQHAWKFLTDLSIDGYIFHLEEDFLFEDRVPLRDMVKILKHDPSLTQIALVRNPVVSHEINAGGLVELWKDSFTQKYMGDVPYLVHNRWFTTNPCLYSADLMAYGWPDGPDSEAKFGDQFSQGVHGLPWMRFAYYGSFGDKPRCFHIGTRTADWKP